MAKSDTLEFAARLAAVPIRAAIWAVTLGLAIGTVFALFARAGFPYELGVHFRPQYVIAGLATAAAAAIFRWRRPAVVCAVVAVWNAGAILFVPFAAPRLARDETPDLTIVWANLRADPAIAGSAARLVREVDADALFLTEADHETREALMAALPDYACASAPVPRRGDDVAYARIAGCVAFDPVAPIETARPFGFLVTRLVLNGIDVRGRHVETPINPQDELARNEQIDATPSPQAPGVLVGDFNASQWSPPILRLQRRGLKRVACGGPFAFTWPADKRGPPVVRIDHAFVTEGVRVRCEIGPHIGSDHYPLIIRVKKTP